MDGGTVAHVPEVMRATHDFRHTPRTRPDAYTRSLRHDVSRRLPSASAHRRLCSVDRGRSARRLLPVFAGPGNGGPLPRWAAAWLLFAVAFGLSTARRRLASDRAGALLLLSGQAAAVLALVALPPCFGLEGAGLVLAALLLGGLVSRRAAFAWIALQSAALMAVVWLHWDWHWAVVLDLRLSAVSADRVGGDAAPGRGDRRPRNPRRHERRVGGDARAPGAHVARLRTRPHRPGGPRPPRPQPDRALAQPGNREPAHRGRRASPRGDGAVRDEAPAGRPARDGGGAAAGGLSRPAGRSTSARGRHPAAPHPRRLRAGNDGRGSAGGRGGPPVRAGDRDERDAARPRREPLARRAAKQRGDRDSRARRRARRFRRGVGPRPRGDAGAVRAAGRDTLRRDGAGPGLRGHGRAALRASA